MTKKAAVGVAGERTYTCKDCGATKIVAIKALPADGSAKAGGEVGKIYKVGGVTYKVTSNKVNTAALVKAKAVKTFKVASKVKIKGKTYKVTAIGPKAFSVAKKKLTKLVVGKNVASVGKQAFAGCAKLKKLIVTSKKLTKKGVKGSLKGSKIKTVQVKVGAKKANKKYAKKYKKIFTKKNCGKKVKVK